MFWEISNYLCYFVFAYFCFAAARAEKKKREYEAQGVVFLPYFPLVSDTIRVIYYATALPDRIVFEAMVTESFKGREIPAKVGICIFGLVVVCFTKADSLDDLFVTKNAFFTKHQLARDAFSPLLKVNLLAMDTDDPLYKTKRKAVAGAFFKSKMGLICNQIKESALASFRELQAEGDRNEVDINSFTSIVQSRIITSILVGSEWATKTLPYLNLKTGEKSDVTLSSFLDRIFNDSMLRMSTNPLFMMAPQFFAERPICALERRLIANCASLRSFCHGILDAKRKQPSTEGDLIQILLEDPNYVNPEDLVEDIYVLFIAGSKTAQTAIANLIITMQHEPEQYVRLRREIDPYLNSVKDDFVGKMDLKGVDDLGFTKMCYQESMRRDAPASMTNASAMSKDLNIDGVFMRKDAPFFIYIGLVHRDPVQWKEPNEFIPDRFDTKSPWYLKPEGGKRNPFAYSPFLGGQRVCLGKTFAEVQLKFVIPLWFHFFDFEFVKEEDKKVRPIVMVGQTVPKVIPMTLTTKNKVPAA